MAGQRIIIIIVLLKTSIRNFLCSITSNTSTMNEISVFQQQSNGVRVHEATQCWACFWATYANKVCRQECDYSPDINPRLSNYMDWRSLSFSPLLHLSMVASCSCTGTAVARPSSWSKGPRLASLRGDEGDGVDCHMTICIGRIGLINYLKFWYSHIVIVFRYGFRSDDDHVSVALRRAASECCIILFPCDEPRGDWCQ